MIADMHAHYPMHLLSEVEDITLSHMTAVRGRRRLGQRLRAIVLALANRFFNYRQWSSGGETFVGPRMTLPLMRDGDVRLAFSVLYLPFDEMDLGRWHTVSPDESYFHHLRDHMREVQQAVEEEGGGRALIARDLDQLEQGLDDGCTVLLHCIEGGLFLGGSPESIHRNVTELREAGVVYVTLAHLFWRNVATNAPAIPFIPDRLYNLVFSQPKGAGLSDLGVEAVKAMTENRVIVDVSHMRQDALDETFALLDQIDEERRMPVIASHAGCRFGPQQYNLCDRTIRQIAEREGVVGLILAQHQLNDGIRRKRTSTLDESMQVIYRHVNHIREVTGDHGHVAIGSDFDGFIKPTMGGLESAADFPALRERLLREYDEQDVQRMMFGNAMRVVRKAWATRGVTP